MKWIGRVLPVLLATWLLSSCAAMFTGTKESMMFTSEPAGAKVLVDGQEVGITPVAYELKKSVKKVALVHPSHGEQSVDVEWKFQTGFLLMDILFTPGYGLLGMLIDGGTRAWYKHPGLIHVDFNKGTVAGGHFTSDGPAVAVTPTEKEAISASAPNP